MLSKRNAFTNAIMFSIISLILGFIFAQIPTKIPDALTGFTAVKA